jgi:hypothetical protein
MRARSLTLLRQVQNENSMNGYNTSNSKVAEDTQNKKKKNEKFYQKEIRMWQLRLQGTL